LAITIYNFNQPDISFVKNTGQLDVLTTDGILGGHISEPLIWIRNDWQSTPCSMPDKRRAYSELGGPLFSSLDISQDKIDK